MDPKISANAVGQSETPYEAYGKYAEKIDDLLLLSGRNRFQANEMKAAAFDVIAKLSPRPNETLLDIGCNIGLILDHLAPRFGACVGQDHPELLEKYKRRGHPTNVTLFPGYWPNAQPEGMFDCILAYSVVQLMPDRDAASAFIDACLRKLAPGGRLLVGDIPNRDAQRRFLSSGRGRSIAEAYDAVRQRDRSENPTEYRVRDEINARTAMPAGYIDDSWILGLMGDARAHGLEVYLLPQKPELPFAGSREDLLFVLRD